MAKKIFKYNWNNKLLIVEYGELAKQAGGSVLVNLDDTVVLVTATINCNNSNDVFFPLTVVFQEKLYSVGKIPGGFLKREGKSSEYGILTARLIDRSLRPLFPDGFRNDVQIVINVLAVNNNYHDVKVAALFASSLAVSISPIPFNGPIAGILITLDKNNKIIINPDSDDLNNGLMELIVAGNINVINMIEAVSKEISEEIMIKAIIQGHKEIKKIIQFQNKIIKEVGKTKIEVDLFTIRDEIINFVNDNYSAQLIKAVSIKNKQERYHKIEQIKKEASLFYNNKKYQNENDNNKIMLELKNCLHNVVRNEIRRQITIDKIRLDGRKINEIRPLSIEIDVLPIVHCSAIFTRGETQVMSILTLGTLGESQIIDGITDKKDKRFMHHYNFPPFSVGETGNMGVPSRREIGHGALSEKTLLQILPSEKEFPYTIRIVSEVLESNGSTSQAAICASTLALMAGGVPIKNPVAGISMGLVKNGKNYTILTDIQGIEDHLGDMDFKVAGSEKGICTLQMDIKIAGINEKIIKEVLENAKVARLFILKNMLTVIAKPRQELSPTAPKMKTFMIPVNKIREIIGTGGKVISLIIEKSNDVKIDIKNDGQVTIYHKEYSAIEKAYELIKNIIYTVKVGEEYESKVVKIEKFGAFVNLKYGIDGLIHISKLSDKRIKKTEDVVKINDKIRVKVIEIDQKGKIKLQLIKVL